MDILGFTLPPLLPLPSHQALPLPLIMSDG